MMLTDGQKKCGVDMTDERDWFYCPPVKQKETQCVEIIKQHLTNIHEVSIIGTRYPYNYVTELHKEYNCKFNLIDFHPFYFRLFYMASLMNNKYGISKNP